MTDRARTVLDNLHARQRLALAHVLNPSSPIATVLRANRAAVRFYRATVRVARLVNGGAK